MVRRGASLGVITLVVTIVMGLFAVQPAAANHCYNRDSHLRGMFCDNSTGEPNNPNGPGPAHWTKKTGLQFAAIWIVDHATGGFWPDIPGRTWAWGRDNNGRFDVGYRTSGCPLTPDGVKHHCVEVWPNVSKSATGDRPGVFVWTENFGHILSGKILLYNGHESLKNNMAFRRAVICHEIGHATSMAHIAAWKETTCMNDPLPSANQSPNGHDYWQIQQHYSH